MEFRRQDLVVSAAEIDCKISSICNKMMLPEEISLLYIKHYRINNVYEWQAKCIYETNVSMGGNLMYCAPTGGGKSLITELVVLMNAIALKKKAIFILPFVSLVVEKEAFFKSIAKSYNRRKSPKDKLVVKSYHGDINWNRNGLRENIIICTIDKANSIMNALILRGQQYKIGCIAIDEIHMLGESFSGRLIESLVRFDQILFLLATFHMTITYHTYCSVWCIFQQNSIFADKAQCSC